jgi:transposase-like protein
VVDDWQLNKSGVPSVNRVKRFTIVPHGTEKIRLMDSNAFQLRLATVPVLDDILRDGARLALQTAIERELREYIERNRHHVDEEGHRLVVRNGYHPTRTIQSGAGPIEVRQPRVNDKRVDEQGNRFHFTSEILPPYLRKTRAIEELVPWLYLKGISTGDFPEALACLGHDGSGLSATTVVRMKEIWQGEYENFSRRPLIGKRYVYVWADGIYFNVRLTDDRPCVLVLMGALEDGTKELIAMIDGQRESEQSWLELLVDARGRGLVDAPMLATGDGALGFWKAIRQVYPSTTHQRCWVHKTANVLNKLPRGQQVSAKSMLHEIWMAATKEEALKAMGKFTTTHQAKYPKAVECLLKDKEELLAFYDFPAEHWQHLRTSNPIESTFATVRLRTSKTKGAGSRTACLAMAFKLVESAQNHWRKLNGSTLLPQVIAGVIFKDGTKLAA